MSVLLTATEDIDFPNGIAPPTIETTSGRFHSYCRYGLQSGARPVSVGTFSPNYPRSIVFPAGAVTSCWVGCYVMFPSYGANFYDSPVPMLGIVKGSQVTKGIWITNNSVSSSSSSNNAKLCISTYDGSTVTKLVGEPGATLPINVLTRWDLQIISYGATGTVNFYVNKSLFLTYTGDIRVTGVSDLDSICFNGVAEQIIPVFSGFVVADEDTRSMIVANCAPDGLGSTHAWTGTYTDVNESTEDDTTLVNSVVDAQDEQFSLANLPSGSFGIKAVAVSARAASTGAGTSKVALGVNSGGTVGGTTLLSPGASWATLLQIYQTNPVTSSDWLPSEINPLQVNLRSGS